MLSRLGLAISAVFRRVMPDPWVIAVLLSVLVAVVGLTVGDFVPRPGASAPSGLEGQVTALLDAWRSDSGLWAFLAFSMQMCLILVTGHALAETRPVRRALRSLSDLPRGTAQAAALVGLVACVLAVVNWGLGLIAGAILARDTGRSLTRRGIRAHYPLIAAAGYTGLMVWHGGLSGSAPLSMTTLAGARKVVKEEYLARLGGEGIPLQETLLAPFNLWITGGLLVLTPVVLWMLAPRRTEDMEPAPLPEESGAVTEPGAAVRGRTIPEWLDRSWPVAWLLAGALLAAVGRLVWTRGAGSIGINEVNMTMLAAGLMLHGSLRSYGAAAEEAARGCAGIMLQFPLYAGIMAMMVESGLVRQAAEMMERISTATTLPVFTYLSAAVLNLFIPSGGGQWGVQGPIALESAFLKGVAPGRVVMAVAYGDQLTNMLQPFWALPLLAITGVKARDIVGYTAVVMVIAGVWIGLGLVVW